MRDARGRFVKGGIAPTKGKKLSLEHRKKLSLAKLGKPNRRKGVIGIYKHTEEWKKQSSERKMGHSTSEETKRKISEANAGAKNGQWKGGVWDKNFSRSSDYK